MVLGDVKRRLLIIGCCMAACGYLFSIATASIGLIILLLTWAINYRENNFDDFFRLNTGHFLILFFLMVLFGLSYSINVDSGIAHTTRYLPFVIVPLIFSTITPLNKTERDQIVKTYVWAVTILFVVCFSYAIYRQILFSLTGGPFNWYFFYRFDFLEIFDQHPTYVAMYTLVSLSLLVFRKQRLFKNRWIQNVVLMLQSIGIVFAGSRIGYVLFIVLLAMYVYQQTASFSEPKKVKVLMAYLAIPLIFGILAWNIPIIKERILYTAGIRYDYRYNNNKFVKKDNPVKQGRLLLWKDALELIELKPIFGHGTGSNMTLLKEKYKEKNHDVFLEREYNTHSTYLGVLLSGGILRLAVYMLLLCSILYFGIKRRDLITTSFFVVVCIVSITEMIFRSQGVMFFAFFYCFLLLRKNE